MKKENLEKRLKELEEFMSNKFCLGDLEYCIGMDIFELYKSLKRVNKTGLIDLK